MKDHEIAVLVNKLRDIALVYHTHQSLRCRIANEVIEAIAKDKCARLTPILLPYMGKPALTTSEIVRKNRKAPFAVGTGTKTTPARIPPDSDE